ncbi:MAG: Aspartyl/glutamyl-tRNA(Asn/Gln) amidotransferase subunit B [Candidatus Wolfebacteria bacterium GW2011_GWA2_42_10]|uniref:Aspartyl/glutamyl-tRNA(Asn/Gln) amidotransferase subunit B n=2 Tax=Candidatus Wolfeibacteriota TaxID=1752735 RepID=A0A0G0ZTM6_9BACT|nr:MAG: Aspartyl/glutamyl-tRNA(Asn/Gln) amidotransferase subunit B [Candidatus Wolfebacteria bacterium GW2011_GWB1_41_12]KKS25361.1 MAG: Aspartyl/glutamyl-tRNA(Asn/Gln) amidotransferase subunit B [Candidatus Wolfebacteria bacterium GW2011_GWA2_42_10]KKT56800.1 MAG: Aspartyl/glutamyl-tRNA(Asn/Gln) amidotransferase subunit B [Candidatus Wolfebacteria bacterium GW2011_GWA1_44_24]
MYQPVIGLEIHVELKTKTKMFCGCLNDPDEKHPNINVCPICLAHPGTLPTINKKAVEAVLKLGLALNSQIPEVSKFDRKNYFYPDLPKGYQISQYDQPLVLEGELNNIRLRRIHLEEDTASLIHGEKGESLVDFNRAGIPLMELVTEPVIKSGEQAVEFAKELQLILRYLEISDADMERGQMRIEANISVSKNSELGTKVEVKNLNSFRSVKEAIDYEIKRQEQALEKGGKIKHETRGWDENGRKTEHQRAKEEAHDYRYFPEPDLPPMDFSKSDFVDFKELEISIPELPAQKRERFIKEFSLKSEQAEILIEDKNLAQYFEDSVSELLTEIPGNDKNKNIQLLFNYLASDIKGMANEAGITMKDLKITPENFADLVTLIIKGEISSRLAKDILKEMNSTGLDPRQIIKEKGLSQISDEEVIQKAIKEAVEENPVAAGDYKKGKQNALQFLIGQTMKKLKGQANPGILRKLFEDYLSR